VRLPRGMHRVACPDASNPATTCAPSDNTHPSSPAPDSPITAAGHQLGLPQGGLEERLSRVEPLLERVVAQMLLLTLVPRRGCERRRSRAQVRYRR
jgi:hypothetical protein